MQVTLTDGSVIEVLGDNKVPYGTPEYMQCGLCCPHLRMMIINGTITTGTACELLCQRELFSEDVLRPLRHGEVQLLRQPKCIELDPEPKKIEPVWLSLIRSFHREASGALFHQTTTAPRI